MLENLKKLNSAQIKEAVLLVAIPSLMAIKVALDLFFKVPNTYFIIAMSLWICVNLVLILTNKYGKDKLMPLLLIEMFSACMIGVYQNQTESSWTLILFGLAFSGFIVNNFEFVLTEMMGLIYQTVTVLCFPQVFQGDLQSIAFGYAYVVFMPIIGFFIKFCLELREKENRKIVEEKNKVLTEQSKVVKKEIESLDNASKVLTESMDDILAVVEETTSTNNQTAQDNSEQATNVQDIYNNTIENTDKIIEFSVDLGNVVNVLNNLTDVSKKISENMNNIAQTTNNVMIDSDNNREYIQSLDDNIRNFKENIDKIDKVLGQIAILAMNASIEAHKAGSDGRGFEAIAKQIKDLNGQTEELVEQISKGYEKISENSSNLLLTNKNTYDKLLLTGNNIAEIKEKIDSFAVNMTKVNTKIDSHKENLDMIIEKDEENKQKLESISEQAQQLSAVTEEVSAIMEETTAKVENIAQKTEDINSSIQELSNIIK